MRATSLITLVHHIAERRRSEWVPFQGPAGCSLRHLDEEVDPSSEVAVPANAVVPVDAAESAEADAAVSVRVAAVLVDAAAESVDAAAGSAGAAAAEPVDVPVADEFAGAAAARLVPTLPVVAGLAVQLARCQGVDFALTKLLVRGPAVEGEAAGRLRRWRGTALAWEEHRRLIVHLASARGGLGDPTALCGLSRSSTGRPLA